MSKEGLSEQLPKPQQKLGFLAMKAAAYTQFPSIRRMSEDWQTIAVIAAENYNIINEAVSLLRDYVRIYPNNSGRAIRFLKRLDG